MTNDEDFDFYADLMANEVTLRPKLRDNIGPTAEDSLRAHVRRRPRGDGMNLVVFEQIEQDRREFDATLRDDPGWQAYELGRYISRLATETATTDPDPKERRDQ